MTASPESEALVKTFVQLGRDLGLKTLAEGVETAGQMDLLGPITSTKRRVTSSGDPSTPRFLSASS
jgi:predicted signal transduction protein with EAL and GGDEF domain